MIGQGLVLFRGGPALFGMDFCHPHEDERSCLFLGEEMT